jgi:hypothetical protein
VFRSGEGQEREVGLGEDESMEELEGEIGGDVGCDERVNEGSPGRY